MTDTPDATYRQHYSPAPDDVTVREGEEMESGDGLMEIRMPIASTGQVRNDNDDPLSRETLAGMAEQIADRQIGVFPAHGTDDTISSDRYSPFERLGDWTTADVDTRDGGADVLVATARMPDPRTLPPATGDYQQALAIIKEQAKRGIGIESSIGWRDDEAFPGDVDLMEASIVGIGADWRTNTGDESAEVMGRAVAAAADGFDVETFVRVIEDARDDSADADGDTTTEASDSDMSDTDDPGDEQTQAGTDSDEQTRAPEDFGLEDWAGLMAQHFDGVSAEDFRDAWEGFADDYVGAVDVDAWADATATVTGAPTDDVADALGDLMAAEENESDEDDESDDETDEEQAGDDDDDDDDEDDEDGESYEQDADVAALRDEISALRDEVSAIQAGDADVADPGEDGTDADGERDTAEDEGGTDETDSDTTDRDAATDDDTDSDAATTGPNWRATN